jgi:Fic family protein
MSYKTSIYNSRNSLYLSYTAHRRSCEHVRWPRSAPSLLALSYLGGGLFALPLRLVINGGSMKWNWQQSDWPEFRYDKKLLEMPEKIFWHQAGFLSGVSKHLGINEKNLLMVDIISDEAYKTSEIEGEYLNRDSLRSSMRRHFGLPVSHHKISPAEQGISELMMNLHQSFAEPLTHEMLFEWHLLLTVARRDLRDVGNYRTHDDPMQVVSGYSHRLKVHFEAPPSKKIPLEMNRFIDWFNSTAPTGSTPLPALIRAGITHLYFVCIHPFEDGNGRIARALTEKALAQSLGAPTLLALSHVIQSHKKAYYDALERANKSNEISAWLGYFSQTIINAQQYTQQMVEFLIEKTKLYDRVRGQLNSRQEKVIARLFEEGVEGFKGGLSAENYLRITGTSRATATRDLQDLVDKHVLKRTGELKTTRYWLSLDSQKSMY